MRGRWRGHRSLCSFACVLPFPFRSPKSHECKMHLTVLPQTVCNGTRTDIVNERWIARYAADPSRPIQDPRPCHVTWLLQCSTAILGARGHVGCRPGASALVQHTARSSGRVVPKHGSVKSASEAAAWGNLGLPAAPSEGANSRRFAEKNKQKEIQMRPRKTNGK